MSVVADISCDIDGPVASTLRASTIADPNYGYEPLSESEVAFDKDGAIAVMALATWHLALGRPMPSAWSLTKRRKGSSP